MQRLALKFRPLVSESCHHPNSRFQRSFDALSYGGSTAAENDLHRGRQSCTSITDAWDIIISRPSAQRHLTRCQLGTLRGLTKQRTFPELLVDLVIRLAQLVRRPLVSLLQLFIVLSYLRIVLLGIGFGTVDRRAPAVACLWGVWTRVLHMRLWILVIGALLHSRLFIAIR